MQTKTKKRDHKLEEIVLNWGFKNFWELVDLVRHYHCEKYWGVDLWYGQKMIWLRSQMEFEYPGIDKLNYSRWEYRILEADCLEEAAEEMAQEGYLGMNVQYALHDDSIDWYEYIDWNALGEKLVSQGSLEWYVDPDTEETVFICK